MIDPFDKIDKPVIHAIKEKNNLKFWCKFCNTIHYHSQEEGPRVAHCFKDTPYSETGYFLKIREGNGFISKKLRFKILSRDRFRCVYCGAGPRETKLHIDHKIAKSNGGSDLEENLVTACLECNLGKGAQ